MTRVWPLVGRADELAAVERAALGVRGRRPGMVLAGAPGVGKTRLAQEVLERSRAAGRASLWVGATESSRGLPLGAFALVVGDVGTHPMRVLQRAADALLAAAGERDPLLVVDDAHLLDEWSAALVQQLAVKAVATVVVTIRSGEPTLDAVESLWKDGHLDRREVEPLSADQSRELLTRVLGGPVDPRSSRRLFDLCDGNVLFLRHLVEGELASGSLHRRAGRWEWTGDLTLSTRLAELVGRQLNGHQAACADLLDTLALAGPLTLPEMERLVPARNIEDGEAAGLVRVHADRGTPQVRLAHPLYGELRAAALGRMRARRLRGEIVRVLAESPDQSNAAVLRRGVLSLESDARPDPGLLLAAAQAALRVFDWDLAYRLATAAADAGGGFNARLTASYALGFGLDPVAGDAALAELTDLATTDLELLAVCTPRAGHLYFMQSRLTEAVAILHEARATLTDPALRPLADGLLALFAAMSADSATALRLAAGVLCLDEAPPLVLTSAHWGRVVSLGALGRSDEIGVAETTVLLSAAESHDSSLPSLGFAEECIRALCTAGRIGESVAIAETFRPGVRDVAGIFSVIAESVGCHSDIARGRVRTAREVATRCLDGMAADTSGWRYVTAASLAKACAMAGDSAAARAAATVMEEVRHPGFAAWETERLLIEAWVDAAGGAVSTAVAKARSAAELAAGKGHWGDEGYALATVVRFGDGGVAERLAELAREVDGPRVQAAGVQAAALVAGDGDGLLRASRMFEDFGDLLSAADAAAQAIGCLADQCRRAPAQVAAARARRLQRDCEDAVTPALTLGLHPLPLTSREREIVALAGAGHSNKEIAERLVVSVRTVEGHLYRAGAKLGTTDRRRFSALLRGD